MLPVLLLHMAGIGKIIIIEPRNQGDPAGFVLAAAKQPHASLAPDQQAQPRDLTGGRSGGNSRLEVLAGAQRPAPRAQSLQSRVFGII